MRAEGLFRTRTRRAFHENAWRRATAWPLRDNLLAHPACVSRSENEARSSHPHTHQLQNVCLAPWLRAEREPLNPCRHQIRRAGVR